MFVYVLKLKDGCWYIGWTTDIKTRLNAHFTDKGSLWTKLHKPLWVEELLVGTKELEKEKTLEYMANYGIKFVRGAGWTSVTLQDRAGKIAKYVSEMCPVGS